MGTFRAYSLSLLLGVALQAPAAAAVDAGALFSAMSENSRLTTLRANLQSLGAADDRDQKKRERGLKQSISQEERRLRNLVQDCRAFVKPGNVADSQMRDRQKRTLLMLVAASGCDAAVELVLADSPTLDARDAKKLCALDYERANGGKALGAYLRGRMKEAIQQRDAETVSLLLDSGLTPGDSIDGEPALAATIRAGDDVLFSLLLSRGAPVNGQTRERQSLLELAARCDRAGMLGSLLNAGAESERPFAEGLSPMFYMAALASDSCFDAYVTSSQKVDRNLLPALVARVGTPAKIRSAVKEPNKEDPQGNIPVHEAARRGDAEVFRILLELGGSKTVANSRGETTLMHAAYSGNAKVLALALEGLEQKDLVCKDKHGATAADYAQRSGNDAVVRLLAEKGLATGKGK